MSDNVKEFSIHLTGWRAKLAVFIFAMIFIGGIFQIASLIAGLAT